MSTYADLLKDSLFLNKYTHTGIYVFGCVKLLFLVLANFKRPSVKEVIRVVKVHAAFFFFMFGKGYYWSCT